MKTTIRISVILISLTFFILLLTAPVERLPNGQLEISAETEVAASQQKAFLFMGNSRLAAEWSIYVDHISLLSGTDGEAGCKRRCFQQADETGIHWDETILLVDPYNMRRLNIYNAKGFPIYNEGLITEQVFTPVQNGVKIKLLLRLPGQAGLWEILKFYAGSYTVRSVFRGNLKNIKSGIEKQ